MRIRRRSAVAGFAAGLLTGAIVVAILLARWERAPAPAGAAGGPGAAVPEMSAARHTVIVTAAQRVSGAVVSIGVSTTRLVRVDPFGGLGGFHDEFFDRFFPQPEMRQRVQGLGSGVIVDGSGLVITNEHVVRDADSVSVTLADGRQFPARVLGGSSIYDLAVVRIRGDRLPFAPLGNSDGLVVGEPAIAIGNPFGNLLNNTEPTVTAGVISATRRDIKSQATETGVYKNMIQTDAAINPGNSGGPLVNADGEVIGINTFIFTPSGGSTGIGFAIPINLARRVLGEIQTYGRVRVAWPGFRIQPVTPYIAGQLGWRDLGGMVVTGVDPGGPAERAGVRVRDRLRRVNGEPVNSVDDAQRSIYGASVGDKLRLSLERGGRPIEVTLVLGELPGGAE
ncbi:MAG TPA: trypsin-like peptidase domain-containing protein [Terriglobales bacterium]|nr:trypsin-like peptidase domain-containing protein [Terriglobales bacterium]